MAAPRSLVRSRPERFRRKFRHYFPRGFKDATYRAWERDYKWAAHEAWEEALSKELFEALLAEESWSEIARRAVRIESATNLLFSFEKMALRDAVRSDEGAKRFALGLHQYLHGTGPLERRFEEFALALEALPRRQTRVLTWPLQTVFAFVAQPRQHIFLKPNVTRRAALAYGFDFAYESRPNWKTYRSLLDFARLIRRDLAEWKPRDLIDIQSFIWVLGSDEYPDIRGR